MKRGVGTDASRKIVSAPIVMVYAAARRPGLRRGRHLSRCLCVLINLLLG
jgi:hypothetical protein